MKQQTKAAIYDKALKIEAYHFSGIAQPFPNHFHEHYVIGLVEGGQRVLSCKNLEYHLAKGSIVLFNPGDNHACVQSDGGVFDYRALNISKPVMLRLAQEAVGLQQLPCFCQNVILNSEISCGLRALHEMLMSGISDFEKEEKLLLLIAALIQGYGQAFAAPTPECTPVIAEKACEFMQQHFSEHISLNELCRYTGASKSALLRAFTKSKGITPYRYLETLRISRAKALLEKGASPLNAALQTGFSDQSHFTNYFSRFIGLAPGAYRDIFQEKSPES